MSGVRSRHPKAGLPPVAPKTPRLSEVQRVGLMEISEGRTGVPRWTTIKVLRRHRLVTIHPLTITETGAALDDGERCECDCFVPSDAARVAS